MKETLFELPKHIVEHKNIKKDSFVKARTKKPERMQVETIIAALDDFLPEDHRARFVWEYVEEFDLSKILNKIKSVESHPGAPAIDPRILFALWLYAYLEGIVSSRVINRYCREHIGFKWICGGVSVNEHTISDFRTNHGEAFDNLLTQSIAVLSKQGFVTLEKVAQDGMKVKAHAGRSSFRREKSLKECLKNAEEYVNKLNKEFAKNPNLYSDKQASAKKKGAEERKNRIKSAIEELTTHREQKEASCKKNRNSFTEKDKQEMRSSTTDPQARVMKMPNGGFSPAYNIQFASDCDSKVIVGVIATQAGNDYGQIKPMRDQIINRLGKTASNILVDSGYLERTDIAEAGKFSTIYAPIENIKETKNQTQSMLDLKKRMQTEKAKEIYKERASTAEFVNARVRTRGLTQFVVRGLVKVQAVATLFAIGQNMLVWMANQ